MSTQRTLASACAWATPERTSSNHAGAKETYRACQTCLGVQYGRTSLSAPVYLKNIYIFCFFMAYSEDIQHPHFFKQFTLFTMCSKCLKRQMDRARVLIQTKIPAPPWLLSLRWAWHEAEAIFTLFRRRSHPHCCTHCVGSHHSVKIMGQMTFSGRWR